MHTDAAILDWLESMHNLHTTVEVLYVVTGYTVSLCWDDEPLFVFEGETLRDAYSAAMDVTYDHTRRRFVLAGYNEKQT